MDALSQIVEDLDLHAEVFFKGGLCGLQAFPDEELAGHLHLLREGAITFDSGEGHVLYVDKPAVIFLPSGQAHKIQVETKSKKMPAGRAEAKPAEAELVCASVSFGGDKKYLLTQALPKFICIELNEDAEVKQTATWIFKEAFAQRDAANVVVNRLCDIFLVQALRFVIANGLVEMGMLVAGSHANLAGLMQALRQNPEHNWSVEEMAQQVAMSRSKFATLFKASVGQAPMDYLTDLRLAAAQGLLKKQKPINLVASLVGYENASSLTRIFKKRFGVTPKQWVNRSR